MSTDAVHLKDEQMANLRQQGEELRHIDEAIHRLKEKRKREDLLWEQWIAKEREFELLKARQSALSLEQTQLRRQIQELSSLKEEASFSKKQKALPRRNSAPHLRIEENVQRVVAPRVSKEEVPLQPGKDLLSQRANSLLVQFRRIHPPLAALFDALSDPEETWEGASQKLDKGLTPALVNQRNEQFQTLLAIALWSHAPMAILEKLLACGADPRLLSCFSPANLPETALEIAAYNATPAIHERLKRFAQMLPPFPSSPPTPETHREEFARHLQLFYKLNASKARHAFALLQSKADWPFLNYPMPVFRRTLLHKAALSLHTVKTREQFIFKLLEMGANPLLKAYDTDGSLKTVREILVRRHLWILQSPLGKRLEQAEEQWAAKEGPVEKQRELPLLPPPASSYV